MTTQPAPTTNAPPQGERVTCSIPGPRNDYGHPKLLATITPDGIWVWCKPCGRAHLISKSRCIVAWEKGESVQCVDESKQLDRP